MASEQPKLPGMADKDLQEKATLTLKILQYLGSNPKKLCLFLIGLTAICFFVTGCVTLGASDERRLLLYHDKEADLDTLKNQFGQPNLESSVEAK